MKKLLVGMLVLCGLAFANCSEEYVSEEVLTLTVASVKPVEKEENYVWLYNGCFIPIYIYKYEYGPEWRLWPSCHSIDGFGEMYEVGYEYVIEVYQRQPVSQNPESISYVYALKEVVSKVRKDSEGIPEGYITE